MKPSFDDLERGTTTTRLSPDASWFSARTENEDRPASEARATTT
jgi:hypothetical protein